MRPAVFQRADVLRQGMTVRQLRRLKKDGVVPVLRRGAYGPTEQHEYVPLWHRHVVLVDATYPKLDSSAIVSHLSAAALHGLASWPPIRGPVHVSRAISRGGRRTGTLHVHPAQLTPRDVVVLGGILVTSPARTVVDVARPEPFETGVVVADDALHRKLVDAAELAEALQEQRGRNGAARAASVLRFADGRSESVGESRSRIALAVIGLPVPQLQYPVHDDEGTWLARPDFAYPDRRVLGEFDGRGKYGALGRGADPASAVFAERLRTQGLEEAGWIVVRWTWDELETPALIKRRLLMAFDRAARLAGTSGTG